VSDDAANKQVSGDASPRIWPVDWCHIVAHVGTIVLIIVFYAQIEGAAGWLAWNLAVLAGVGVLAWRARGRSWRRAAVDRILFTSPVIPIFFTQLGDLIEVVNPKSYEVELVTLDRWLFGGRDPLEALESWSHPLLTEYLQWVYDFYYFIPILLAAALLKHGEARALARTIFAFALCIYLSYLGYYLVPATGPNIDEFSQYDFNGPLQGIFLAAELRETLFAIEKIKLNCFPSGHTAVSVLALLIARSYCPRILPLLFPLVVSLVFSTLYLRYHYVADVVAGILLAWGSYWGGLSLHHRFERAHWGEDGDEG
jgi:membrane-associated phospholipid phosphatase